MSNSPFSDWAAFADNLTIGARTLHILRSAVRDPRRARQISASKLRGLGLDEKTVAAVAQQQRVDPDGIARELEQLGIDFVWYDDPRYPVTLTTLPDPPACLYVRGSLEPVTPSIAIVGSRSASPYGRQVAGELARDLAAAGLTVISGLAFGIDAIAHQATLDMGGRTIGVLANGLHEIYPTTHRALGREIVAKGGALISEFPPGTPALRHHFPIRNRIIAGLTLGTLVVEAAEESGSLLTARCALDYNREVFAVPGPITSPLSAGPHGLIRLGAKLVTQASDILDELRLEQQLEHTATQKVFADSPTEATLLDHLTREPIQLDDLVRQSGLTASEVSGALLLMEMKGRVRNLGAHQYILRRSGL